jgi:hypothetical protein
MRAIEIKTTCTDADTVHTVARQTLRQNQSRQSNSQQTVNTGNAHAKSTALPTENHAELVELIITLQKCLKSKKGRIHCVDVTQC